MMLTARFYLLFNIRGFQVDINRNIKVCLLSRCSFKKNEKALVAGIAKIAH